MTLLHRLIISAIAIAMPLFFINCSAGGDSATTSPTNDTKEIVQKDTGANDGQDKAANIQLKE